MCTFPHSPRHPRVRQGQLGTGPNKAERAREREAILKQLEVALGAKTTPAI